MTGGFTAGEVAIQRIVELETGFLPAREMLPGLSEEQLAENRAWLSEAGAIEPETDRLVLCFQSYILRTPRHTVLVDSCIGNGKDRPTRPAWHLKQDDTWMRGLAAAGLSVEDIDVVMCTHLHPDHVGWNTRLEDGRWVPTFPNARYLFSAQELAHWQERHVQTPVPHLVDSVLPVIAAGRVELVATDHALDDHVRLLPTPGHTPHHFAVCVGRGRDDAILTGDFIHSPLQARYPELSVWVDADPTQAAATRRGALERLCDTPTLCCGAHFPSPSVGRIKRRGDGFRCEPVE